MINQETINKLLVINENLEKAKKEVKKLSDKKKILEQKVLELMEQHNLIDTQIETSKYNIDYTKRKVYQSISKNLLEDKIEQFCNDKNIDNITDELIKFIYNSRDCNETPCLKIKSKCDKQKKCDKQEAFEEEQMRRTTMVIRPDYFSRSDSI